MSSIPQLDEALWDLTDATQFQVIKKTSSDFEAEETDVNDVIFEAHMQPVPPQKLLIKPEGQRTWRWWLLWTDKELDLDWILKDAAGRLFRVMSKSNWQQAGFFEYELTETVVPS